MSKIVIHIGLPKTGSSYLQKNVFPFLKDVNYFRSFGFSMLGDISSSNTFLFSHEGLSGHPWNQPWRDGVPNSHNWMTSFKVTTDNLKQLYPEAHIIVVFRKHGDLLVSLYKQYLHEGGILKFKDFYHPNGVINDEDLNFQLRIEKLREDFENVDVLSFEEFKTTGLGYFIDYFKNLGFNLSLNPSDKNENIGVSGKKIEMIRFANKFYRNIPRFIKFIFFKTKFTPRDIFQRRLSFWKSPDSRKWIQIKEEINLKFRKDWDYIIQEKTEV